MVARFELRLHERDDVCVRRDERASGGRMPQRNKGDVDGHDPARRDVLPPHRPGVDAFEHDNAGRGAAASRADRDQRRGR
jgi:hypothetical protein